MRGPKEIIYDEQIAPLLSQIIVICKQHKIALLAEFALDSDKDGPLQCTTALLSVEFEPSRSQLEAVKKLI